MSSRDMDKCLPRLCMEEIVRQHSVDGIVETYLKKMEETKRGVDSLVETLRERIELATRGMDHLARVSVSVARSQEMGVTFTRGIAETFEATQKALRNALEEFPERQRRAYIALAQRGWYIDFNMPVSAPLTLARAFEEGDAEESQRALAAHYEERLPEIIGTLQVNYPRRAMVLKAAFAAHTRHEYELSVPVFLAQADGICHELLNASPFRRRRSDGKPTTADWVEKAASIGLAREALCLLGDPLLPICMNERERGQDFVGLNRHQVLHGESWDYGTQINSLKAASFLNYIGDFLTKTVRGKAHVRNEGGPQNTS